MKSVYAFFALVPVLGSCAHASAATSPLPESVATAKALMLNNRYPEAETLLKQLALTEPRSNDVAFLLGLLALRSRDYDAAVDAFRSILIRSPDAFRVRLELGRAFFLKRDYENAFRQFQFARAAKLPPGVEAAIDRYVESIRKEKNWSYNVSFAVAPDTNINNGTSARETELFGLPFELGDETRQKSGIGVSLVAGGEFAPRLNERTRLRLGANIQRREYSGTDSDDMTLAMHAGPRLVLTGWDVSLLATVFRRRFGGALLVEGAGARIEATRYHGRRTALSLGASAGRVRYPDYPLQDGNTFAAWGGAVRALTPASTVNARIGFSRKTARTPELASRSGWITVGYFRDFPGGFSVYVEPGYGTSRFDSADPFFDMRRKDRMAELQLAVLNRRIILERFTPRVALTFARRNSTIDVHDFRQRRLEVGLTSSF
jgi:hypothetical protein